MRALLTLAAAATISVTSARAHADVAAAEALFQEGRALLDQGDVDAACDKFESSQTSEASSGTLLNLADCRLKQGRVATAWAQFVAAGRLAQVQNRPEHAAEAERRSAELEPSLSTLTLRVAEPVPGLEILVNGRAVSSGSYGTRVPTDPGTIAIEARAPRRKSIAMTMTLRAKAHHLVVDVPALEQRSDEPLPNARAPQRDAASAKDGALDPLAFVVGGLGVAALATGSVFGVMALSSNDEALELCNGGTRNCPDAAIAEERDRDREAMFSTVFVAAGVLGVGAGVVLLVSSAPSEPASSAGFFELRVRPLEQGGFVSGRARF